MNKVLSLVSAVVLLTVVPTVGYTANVKPAVQKTQKVEKPQKVEKTQKAQKVQKTQKMQTSSHQDVKSQNGVTMYANAPKALFAGNGESDVKTALLDSGATAADVYTLNIKNENEMNYAVYADVAVDGRTLSVTNRFMSGNMDAAQLASAINAGSVDALGKYTVVTPLAKQGNRYVGTLKYNSIINNNSYSEILHVALSDDKYNGINARFISIDEASDAKIFPKVSELLQAKN